MQSHSRILTALTLVAVGAALAACQSRPSQPASQSSLDVMEKVAVAANRCWFKSNDPAFKTYAFAPELSSFSDRPRILLTRKGSSDIRPLLVVQAEGRPPKLSAFGPMMDQPIAGRVNSDVTRWAAGSADCR